MRLIGTAGHIDHGKSTLVEALTGTHPSRLPEERARGMTIDLGFAHLRHPDGRALGVVDVPGHEKLVRTMVAGATGFEVALWVVDAREGVMPQSREHLHILALLGVRALVPVVTKADLATAEQVDATRRALVPLLERLGAPVRPVHVVDSLSGRGIPALTAAIFAACDDGASPDADAPPYLPVDRAFSVKGAGTVVTGTLVRGRLAEGDALTFATRPGAWRVRALHNHHRRVAAVGAGDRVGVNLAGLDVAAVRRGDVLVAPGHPYVGRRVNVRLRWTPNAPTVWAHGARLRFHAGSADVECRLWDVAPEGDAVWAQVELPGEFAFFAGQRFILRGTGPLATVGGGEVLDLAPDRPRRVTPAERAAYVRQVRGEAAVAAYVDAAAAARVLDLGQLARRWLRPETAIRREAEASPGLRVTSAPARLLWRAELEGEVLARLRRLVAAQPPREQTVSDAQLARELGVAAEHVATLLRTALARGDEASVWLRARVRVDRAGATLYPGVTALVPAEQQVADELLARLRAEWLQPSTVEAYRGVDPARRTMVDRALAHLRETRQAVRVSAELWLHADAVVALREAPARHGLDGVRAAEFGRALGLSRKYSIPYVDYLNREGVLRREGDVHYRTGRGG